MDANGRQIDADAHIGRDAKAGSERTWRGRQLEMAMIAAAVVVARAVCARAYKIHARASARARVVRHAANTSALDR